MNVIYIKRRQKGRLFYYVNNEVKFMILDNIVKINMHSNNKLWFENKGYDVSQKVIMAKIDDLKPNSPQKISCKCDYCGKEFKRCYYRVRNKEKHSCGNQECKKLLRKETNLERFGVENTAFSKELMQKAAEKFKKNFGKGSPGHDDYVKRRKETNFKNCGNFRGYADENGESHSKRMKTMIQMFYDAKCRKGIQKAVSEPQVHICELLDGILNYPLKNKKICIDIALDEDKISIEYNGIGHYTYRNDKDDDFRDKELFDEFGWKSIRFSTHENNMISDELIIKFVDWCKRVFNSSNEFQVIYDLDANKVCISRREVDWLNDFR